MNISKLENIEFSADQVALINHLWVDKFIELTKDVVRSNKDSKNRTLLSRLELYKKTWILPVNQKSSRYLSIEKDLDFYI